ERRRRQTSGGGQGRAAPGLGDGALDGGEQDPRSGHGAPVIGVAAGGKQQGGGAGEEQGGGGQGDAPVHSGSGRVERRSGRAGGFSGEFLREHGTAVRTPENSAARVADRS